LELKTKINQVGASHELLRKIVGRWPFERGTQRIPAELGKAFMNMNSDTVIGRVGKGDVLFPYQPGDVAHPGFWFLYEKGVRRVIRKLLAPGSVYIDIGAHRGWHAGYALALVKLNGTVIACEPHPHHASCLRQLASLNPGRDFRIHEMAVSERSGQTTLLASQEEGWHTIIPEFNELCDVPRQPIGIKTISLDALISQHTDLKFSEGPARVLIKIDAEGAERDILRGAEKTLKLPSIRALIMECTGGAGVFQQRASECIRLLKEAKWRVRVITHGGCRPWTDADTVKQVNILALRN
jgi:FkbM family methyltransferase